MYKISVTKARADLPSLLGQIEYAHERVELTRHGKTVAGVVSVGDLALLEALEDAEDSAAVRAALANPENRESVPWEQVRDNLGR